MKPSLRFVLYLCALLVAAALPIAARADNTGREAARHFQRGVELYNDGDFRGALVEFKRAYKLLPRAGVLYDIGETEFQLQEYAAALSTMRRFLAETGPTAAHRAEVEATVETLSGRVGRVALAVDVAHCDVTVDDQPIGTTPLPEPILVSIGSRKLAVACADRPLATRRVEIAAGELLRVDVPIGPSLTPALRGVAIPTPPAHTRADSPELREQRRVTRLALAWSATTLLAAATLGVGTAALVEGSQLSSLRQTYPGSPSELDRRSALVHGLSIAADTVGVAALAVLGVSTWVTVRDRRERRVVLGVAAGATGAGLQGRF